MAETTTKSDAGLKLAQAEITIIEEKLSMTHGILPREIATSLSNRFDKILLEISKNRSQLTYLEATIPGKNEEAKKARVEKTADIMNKKKELDTKRQEMISHWYNKVLAYIEKAYGKPIKSEAGLIIAYGEEGRIEVMKNRHLRKLW